MNFSDETLFLSQLWEHFLCYNLKSLIFFEGSAKQSHDFQHYSLLHERYWSKLETYVGEMFQYALIPCFRIEDFNNFSMLIQIRFWYLIQEYWWGDELIGVALFCYFFQFLEELLPEIVEGKVIISHLSSYP